jgi:uncharacterized protein (DUF2225 family)
MIENWSITCPECEFTFNLQETKVESGEVLGKDEYWVECPACGREIPL